MNPITNAKNVAKMNERELEMGIAGTGQSWHNQYKHSAWVFIGGLPYDLTEGDILCVFSQYGEIVNVNLVRDKDTGKSKGFCFLCYEDQRSTILAVDNLNTIKILGRIIRVDHCEAYRPPKEHGDEDDVTKALRSDGCAPKAESSREEEEEEIVLPYKKPKKEKKKKIKKEKKKKEKKKKRRKDSSSEGSSDENTALKTTQSSRGPLKQEQKDPGYDKYLHKAPPKTRHVESSSGNSDSSSDGPNNRTKRGGDKHDKSNRHKYTNRDYQSSLKLERESTSRDRLDHKSRDQSYKNGDRDNRRNDHSRNYDNRQDKINRNANQPAASKYTADSRRSRSIERDDSRSNKSRDLDKRRQRSVSRERDDSRYREKKSDQEERGSRRVDDNERYYSGRDRDRRNGRSRSRERYKR